MKSIYTTSHDTFFNLKLKTTQKLESIQSIYVTTYIFFLAVQCPFLPWRIGELTPRFYALAIDNTTNNEMLLKIFQR